MKTYLIVIIICTNAAAIKTASVDRYGAAAFFGLVTVFATISLAYAVASDMFHRKAEEILECSEDKPYLN